jgi:cell division protein FtsW
MNAMSKSFDRMFLFSVIALIVVGFFIFSSASLGLLAKGGDRYSSATFSQTFFGLFLGTLALIITSRIPYRFWRKVSFIAFGLSLILSVLVFVPGIGFEHGGAHRWLHLFGFSFQPSELLKISFVVYMSAWVAGIKDKVTTIKYGLLPMLVILGLVAIVLLSQPDTDVLAITALAGFAIFLTAGGKWRHMIPVFLIGVLCVGIIISARPYIKQRIQTFINPAENGLTSSYQIQQSLIAIGSGGLTGRGFGQSIQKFNFLPEPTGDSIFAVAGEEFGFTGTIAIVAMFVLFGLRGLKIAARTTDPFGKYLIVGIVALIVSQAFLNMGAMLGILPLTGNPLPFVSHGGTALFFTLAEVGIILNISKGQKKVS